MTIYSSVTCCLGIVYTVQYTVTKLVIESNLSCIVVASHQYLRQDKIPPLMSGNVAFVTDNGLSFYNQIFFLKRFLNNYIHTRRSMKNKI